VNVVRGVLSMGISQNRKRRLQAVAAQFLLGITGLAALLAAETVVGPEVSDSSHEQNGIKPLIFQRFRKRRGL
jgi:hypothetical protein